MNVAKPKKNKRTSMVEKKGILIVIDGIDGSGKATQARLLEQRFKKEGRKVQTIDFPQYEENFFGKLIGEYLSGKFGDFASVDPRLASLLYAADRFESSSRIQSWLSEGFVVIVDRYVSANQIHQGGKINSSKERKAFLSWLEVMEHGVFRIPRPDMVIYLDVPFEVSQARLKEKTAKDKKKYLKGGRDVVEQNERYLRESRKSALLLHKANAHWKKIDAYEEGRLLTPDEVHKKVYSIIQKKLKM